MERLDGASGNGKAVPFRRRSASRTSSTTVSAGSHIRLAIKAENFAVQELPQLLERHLVVGLRLPVARGG